jgi:hypothetical protein
MTLSSTVGDRSRSGPVNDSAVGEERRNGRARSRGEPPCLGRSSRYPAGRQRTRSESRRWRWSAPHAVPDSGVSQAASIPLATPSKGIGAWRSRRVFSEPPRGVRIVWIDGRETRGERRCVAGAVRNARNAPSSREAGGAGNPAFVAPPGWRPCRQRQRGCVRRVKRRRDPRAVVATENDLPSRLRGVAAPREGCWSDGPRP